MIARTSIFSASASRRAAARRARARRAFTLTEMLVVIAIMVIIILLAIPAVRSLSGTKSIAAAENTLSALITRAREEAVGIQDYRGVLFYLDPADDTMKGMIVMATPATIVDGTPPQPAIYLDAVPDHDRMSLPGGIGIQCVNDQGSGGSVEHYLGFNPFPPIMNTTYQYGGVILFDGSGRLVSTTYGFKLSTSTGTQTNLAIALHVAPVNTVDYAPQVLVAIAPLTANLRSQLGFVLYDREAFANASGTNGDVGLIDSTVTDSAAEAVEETWLDANSTPILINRYTGTLIRAE